MNRKLEVYVKKAKRIYRTVIILGILIFLLGVLISIVYNKFSKKEPIDEVQTSSNGDETESFTNDTGEVLLNPGKGWVLYNNKESNKYNDIVNIGYTRIDWCDVEKSEGEYNWDIIDQRIKVYENKGKKYSFGILCASSSSKSEYVTPKWVFDAGAKYYTYYNKENEIEQKIPIWTDKIFLSKLNDFIQALAQRYDGNKNIAFIDIRSYGNFGEQHLGTIGGEYISSDVLINSYLKPYRDAFSKTLLVSPCGEKRYEEAYRWGVENGISLRRDGIFKWSDGSECAMAYGKAPTVFEYTADYNWMKKNNYWSYDNLIQYINNGKPSYLQFDPNMYNENKEFCKYIANKIGYYFKFKQANYTNTIKTTENNDITLTFTNEGVAPLYEPCTFYIGLLDQKYNLVKKYKTDINPQKWMPNEESKEEISLQLDGVDDGDYIIALGLFYNENDEKPTYLLGNTGKTDDNWYVFGNINITNPPEEYEIKSQNDEKIINQEEYKISVKIDNIRKNNNYNLKIFVNNNLKQIESIDNTNLNYSKEFNLNFEKGKNTYKIQIEKDGKVVNEYSQDIYVTGYNTDNSTVSSNILQGYSSFTEKCKNDINQSTAIWQQLQNLKQNAQSLTTSNKIEQSKAEKMMQEHYKFMSTFIEINKNSTDYEKMNSAVNDLEAVGCQYENIVSTNSESAQKTINDANGKIQEIQNILNNNQDLNMTIVNNILNKCNSVYGELDEINTINTESTRKAGIIEGKVLHIQLLSDWATQFANLYIDTYIKNNPVTIDYSETNPTNQNVTATLRTNTQITINNNSNSKVYTFTQNGTFTFDYTIKGQTFQQTATVNNIDKTAPTIEGVENDRLYLSEVTPKASDTNLKEVLLYKDNNQVQNYQQNTKITEDGHYKLVAEDSAGNQTSVEFDISRNPAIIDYSEVNLTNQDVVATVNSNFDVNVKNNSNQKSYTFNENGEFTFELNIKGAELQLTAKVDNIDKTPPTITDVEDKKQYIDKVTPKISDDNLNEVKLYFDSEEVQGYTPNSEITGEGFYKLVAKDLAGNETSVEFTIIENPDEKYQIKYGNILNIKNNTNQDTFRKKLKMSGEYSIYRNDTLISDNDKIATGDKLRKSTGEEYTLIVSGDINNDGDVNIKDIVMLRKYLLERNNLDENSLLAADCNLDGKDISIKDLIRMRLIALERDVN